MVAVIFMAAAIIFTINENFPNQFKITINYAKNGEPKFTFDIALYYVIITMTTVGYGDIVPTSTLSRISVALFFIGVFVFITYSFLN